MRKLRIAVTVLYIFTLLIIVAILGAVAPYTLFGNALDSIKTSEGPAGVYLFMTVAVLGVGAIFVILATRLKNDALFYLDRRAAGDLDEDLGLFAVIPRPGRFEKVLIAMLIGECAILCATGYGQYVTLANQGLYWRMCLAHSLAGILCTLTLALYLFQLSRRLFTTPIILLLTFYPVMYLLILQTPGPLLAQYVAFNLLLLPLAIYLLAWREIAPAQKPAFTAAALTLFAFILVVLTGMSPVVDPLHLRFAFRHRIFHAWITPVAILLPVYFHWCRWGDSAADPARRRRQLGLAVLLLAAGTALGAGLHRDKENRLERIRARNHYYSVTLAAQRQAPFRTIRPGVMSDDTFCGGCHRIPFAQWRRSVHANAARTSTFQKVVSALMQKHGPGISLDCAACHDPEVAYLQDAHLLTDPAHLARSQGVSCRSCHYMKIAGDKNFLYALEIPRLDLDLKDARFKRLRVLSAVQEHVGDVTKPITTNGEMCYPCHSLRSMRQGHEQVPIDNVTSFQQSAFSNRMPCHRCHMPRIEQDERSYSWMDHSFFGIQEELPRVIVGADSGLLEALAVFTRDTGLWMQGRLPVLHPVEAAMDETFKTYRFRGYLNRLRGVMDVIHVTGAAHFSMDIKSAAVRGSSLNLVLTTTNENIGHDFPSSLFANIVRVWFELTVADASGKEIYRSRFDQDDLTHQLGRMEVDADNRPIAPSESLNYVTIINKKFIEPGKGYDDAYSIALPPGTRFPLKASYRLCYKRYNDEFIDWVSGGAMEAMPVRVLARETFKVPRPRGVAKTHSGLARRGDH